MLEHTRTSPLAPESVVVMGAKGFVGSTIVNLLRSENIPTTALSSTDINLLDEDAPQKLTAALTPSCTLILLSGITPCKDNETLVKNITMMNHVCTALAQQPVGHVIHISSDAVYADGTEPVTEQTPAAPSSLHGVMHLAREIMLRDTIDTPTAILRPSLLYGVHDPHNAYGPNRFRRTAASEDRIVLFGDGEETRDHVDVTDVAQLAFRCLLHGSHGILNVATGTSRSFHQIAEIVAAEFSTDIEIEVTPRQMPITHRTYDVSQCLGAFPDFVPVGIEAGLARVHATATEEV